MSVTDDEMNGDRSVWNELRNQRDILIVLQTQMATLIQSVTQTKDDHETRLRKLEERKFPLPTIAVLISAASLVASVVMYVMKP